MKRLLTVTLFVLCAGMLLFGQAPDLTPASGENSAPAVEFEFVLPESNPSHYVITVDSLGRAAYRSDPVAIEKGAIAGDPFLMSFVLSNPVRDRVFELAEDLDYFQGNNFEFKGKVANMGAKSLVYRDRKREFRASYNFTTNQKMQELATIFQGISTTMEYLRRLQWLHRFEPLGLEAEMKKLETDVKAGRLVETQLLEPELSKIAANQAVMNITRRRAQGMLARIGAKDEARR